MTLHFPRFTDRHTSARRIPGTRRLRVVMVAAILTTSSIATGLAQTKPSDLGGATLEELMNIEITSASRKEQRAADVPAAVYVIRQDEIRRSGMTRVPDLLRLVPGVQVAQINSNKWAVSVRGFNGMYSNKLLVLVDGRSVYNPAFATVFWETEDLMLDDVDRIEVIRGPGAAVWGANAVNGVINIVTKKAADSAGALVRVDSGTFDPVQVAARYGGSFGKTSYRLYSQWSDRGDSPAASGTPARDNWRSVTNGFRADWESSPDSITLQGSMTAGRDQALWIDLGAGPANQTVTLNGLSDTRLSNVLGRWTHTRANGASLQIQSFLDFDHHHEPAGDYDRHTVDFDAEYHTAVGAHHDIVAGGGFRQFDEVLRGGPGYSLPTANDDENLFNAFAQDEIALARNRVGLTLGAKLEHDAYAGTGLQPTARIMWRVEPHQHLWGSISRALRTPSLLDRSVRVTFPAVPGPGGVPMVIAILGNPTIRNERFSDAEAGYRLDIRSTASVDVTGFVGRYDGLQALQPFSPGMEFTPGPPHLLVGSEYQNALRADTAGLELAARWNPVSRWQLDGSYTQFHLRARSDQPSVQQTAATFDGNAPHHQWRLHSATSLGRAQVDASIYEVGRLNYLAVPGYVRADARFEVRVNRQLSLNVAGQNLLQSNHAEFSEAGTLLSTLVPRSVSIGLRWKF